MESWITIEGEFLCEWPRATRKGQWSTNPDHLPDNYKGFTQWNAPYFIQKAQLIGKNTEDCYSYDSQIQTITYIFVLHLSTFLFYNKHI